LLQNEFHLVRFDSHGGECEDGYILRRSNVWWILTDVSEEFTASRIWMTMEAVSSAETSVNIYRLHGGTFQKTAIFMNFTYHFEADDTWSNKDKHYQFVPD
jgi:hypothetical protein